ncbi:MAG: DUF6165 family protein [Desulfobulbaceae bacterium]|nr:DUF6165 family protein [Desulfobulbaceae bacterium]
MTPTIPISWGELFDKITILEIKSARINDNKKQSNILKELSKLNEVVAQSGYTASPTTEEAIQHLKEVNEDLWSIEDDIRECERQKKFDAPFIKLARSVYITNDKRSNLKLRINMLLGSELLEEKSYQDY